jgi:hypothetical protein
MKLEVVTELVLDEKNNRSVVNIKFPANQKNMTLPDTIKVLSSGVALLIRGATKENCGMTDYELMNEVISYLNSEFVSSTNFNDVKVYKKAFGNE